MDWPSLLGEIPVADRKTRNSRCDSNGSETPVTLVAILALRPSRLDAQRYDTYDDSYTEPPVNTVSRLESMPGAPALTGIGTVLVVVGALWMIGGWFFGPSPDRR